MAPGGSCSFIWTSLSKTPEKDGLRVGRELGEQLLCNSHFAKIAASVFFFFVQGKLCGFIEGLAGIAVAGYSREVNSHLLIRFGRMFYH